MIRNLTPPLEVPKKHGHSLINFEVNVKTSLPNHFTIEDSTISDKKVIANAFNNYFCSLAEYLNKSINNVSFQ